MGRAQPLNLAAIRIIGAGCCLAIAGLCCVDLGFWQRYLSRTRSSDAADLAWRSPQEVVAGSERELPIAAVGSRTISAEAIRSAENYAAATQSGALLVWHGGALQAERYWAGYERSTRADTASMHKSVMGMLVGIAIQEGHIASVADPVERYIPNGKAIHADESGSSSC